MTNLLKKSKKVFSIALAFAIVALSLFTGVDFSANAAFEQEINCASRKTIYWNGGESAITTGSGAKNDPYIIKTADEFAWLIKQNADATKGEYFEIDKEIGAIVLQPETYANAIIALKDAAAVKTYFKTNAANMKSWPNVGLEQATFCGSFDGNGATVYGLYQSSTANAGLFSAIDAGATIKNIGLKNSYITSTSTEHNAGALAAATNGDDYGVKATGAVWFDSCVVANNYINNPSVSYDNTGVIVGSSQDIVYVDNCLVYGNDATYGAIGCSTYVPTSQDPEWKSRPQDYKLLAFTFDDGPSANMPRYVNLFSSYEGTGTFFVRGISISGDSSYQLMQSAIDAGWDIGNHGDKHLNAMLGGSGGGEVTYDQIKADINNLTAKLENNLTTRDGEAYNVRFYRPPNIKPTENTFKVCTEENLGVIWLKHDALDWSSSKTYTERYNVFKNGIGTWKDGDVILCHEIGVVWAEDTYKILEELLPEFYEAGYRFCSISELMQMRGITQNQISGKLENKSNNKGMVTNILGVARDKDAPVWGCANNSVMASDDFVKPEGLEMADDGSETPQYYNMIRNSIILDTPAFDYAQQQGKSLNEPKCFENVITNVNFEKYLLPDGKIFAANEEQIKVVANLADEELSSAFIKTDSMPELRSFHDNAIANGAEGHSISCSCGLVDSNITPHLFENDCQLGCLVCSWTPNGHSYDNACDSACNVCGQTRTPSDHVYDNTCDTSCNECSAERGITHTYSNNCDAECNICGATRNVPDHIYDDMYDADCNECGDVREVPPLEWQVSPYTTGVYNITPNKTLQGFNKDSITVYDKNGGTVKYNDTKKGWPLVKDQEYTIMLNTEYTDTNDLSWNLSLKADTIFSDTKADAWYNDAVTYAVGAGIISGYENGKFGTSDTLKREQFLTILARFDGVDLSQYVGRDSGFKDVKAGSYYEAAVIWGVEMGITTGYTDGSGKFGVGDNINREQIVTFLYRYALSKGYNITVAPNAQEQVAARYPDFAKVSPYAKDAVVWAISNGVIEGKGGTAIAPQGNTLRCEIAKIMYNIFLNDIFSLGQNG